jgi:hypothetical protein
MRFTTKSAEDTENSLSAIIGRLLFSPQKENSACLPCGRRTRSQIRARLVHHFLRPETQAHRLVRNLAGKLHFFLVA